MGNRTRQRNCRQRHHRGHETPRQPMREPRSSLPVRRHNCSCFQGSDGRRHTLTLAAHASVLHSLLLALRSTNSTSRRQLCCAPAHYPEPETRDLTQPTRKLARAAPNAHTVAPFGASTESPRLPSQLVGAQRFIALEAGRQTVDRTCRRSRITPNRCLTLPNSTTRIPSRRKRGTRWVSCLWPLHLSQPRRSR